MKKDSDKSEYTIPKDRREAIIDELAKQRQFRFLENNKKYFDMLLKEDKASQRSRNKLKTILSSALIVIFVVIIVLSLYITLNLATNEYYSKEKVHLKIAKAAANIKDSPNTNALEIIENVYSEALIKRKFYDVSPLNSNDIYTSDYPLSQVLVNIISEAYESDDFKAEDIIPVEEILVEYRSKKPFDVLDDNQIDYFKNISIKTGSDYKFIENDLLKIVDQLYNKNRLVDKYLAKSNLSFTISLVALFASLLIGIIQLIKNRKSNMKSLFYEALEEYGANLFADSDPTDEDNEE